ncbi:hypothetical protein [Martelella mangrovi]|uniref:Uncharacterized protein n=1 Tax=Martelella mangrovi TaxID=1397477 RepID=A0ABV2I7I6_9HYPH
MREDILPATGSDFGETDGHSQERNATGDLRQKGKCLIFSMSFPSIPAIRNS